MTADRTTSSVDVLPMDEIRRSIGGAAWAIHVGPSPWRLPELEDAMAATAFEYFSSDPDQRTWENVHDVCMYLYIWYGGKIDVDPPVPPAFDDDMIDKISDRQEMAATALYSMNMLGFNFHRDDIARMSRQVVNCLVLLGSLNHEQEARTTKQRVARDSHARGRKGVAMAAIREEFMRWQSGVMRYRNDADFAKHMHADHSEVIANEGSIKNAIARWRRGRKSSC